MWLRPKRLFFSLNRLSRRILKRVSPVRQIEIAELMVSANNFTKGYAEGLFTGTAKDQLVDPRNPKTKAISPEDLAKMEAEMEILERDFKSIEDALCRCRAR